MSTTFDIIFLMGPTASGKSELALLLAQLLPIDIISVDSALVYRGMDIGTAKPSWEDRQQVIHHLIDICDPAQTYSVADFRMQALQQISNIIAAGRIPLLVGGTMLYFKSLLCGLAKLPSANIDIRKYITEMALSYGWNSLHSFLAYVDPKAADRIHPHDPQRLSRALEVFILTGNRLSHLLQTSVEPLPYRVLQCAIAPHDRAQLHKNIEQRFHKMLQQGFEQEVLTLKQRSDLHLNLPSIRCVGYRQMWYYLEGTINYQQMIQQVHSATRQLAKRQLSWLKHWPDLFWFDSQEIEKAVQYIKHKMRS